MQMCAASVPVAPVASTRTRARSAVDAPVAMLRVYWRWPGQSAMTNLRVGVAA